MFNEWAWSAEVHMKNGNSRTNSGEAESRFQGMLKAGSWVQSLDKELHINMVKINIYRRGSEG